MTGRYEMLLQQNADVPMRDSAILQANVYRPNADGRFPVLMTFGPYGKDVPLREFMQEAWDRLNTTYPEILAASSCKHLVFERPDPEMWVPDGYVVINVDSRGAGKSPGRLAPNSPAEFRDFYDAIEWAIVAKIKIPPIATAAFDIRMIFRHLSMTSVSCSMWASMCKICSCRSPSSSI